MFKCFRQIEHSDCGLTCIRMIADRVLAGAPSTDGLPEGIYIVNGRKTVISE